MTEQEHQVVEHVVAQLVQAFPVQCIILFGSRDCEEATEDSGYDFLVVQDSELRRTQTAVAIRNTAHIPCVPMDFLVHSPVEWEEGRFNYGIPNRNKPELAC